MLVQAKVKIHIHSWLYKQPCAVMLMAIVLPEWPKRCLLVVNSLNIFSCLPMATKTFKKSRLSIHNHTDFYHWIYLETCMSSYDARQREDVKCLNGGRKGSRVVLCIPLVLDPCKHSPGHHTTHHTPPQLNALHHHNPPSFHPYGFWGSLSAVFLFELKLQKCAFNHRSPVPERLTPPIRRQANSAPPHPTPQELVLLGTCAAGKSFRPHVIFLFDD